MLYNFLKQLALDNNWFFEYSRPDYQNLYDGMEYNKIHLFVDPITTTSTFQSAGSELKSFSGKMMLLVSSDVDETYSDKYEDYIKPLIDNTISIIKSKLTCYDYDINQFQVTEVINLFDVNLDGLLITYNVTLQD